MYSITSSTILCCQVQSDFLRFKNASNSCLARTAVLMGRSDSWSFHYITIQTCAGLSQALEKSFMPQDFSLPWHEKAVGNISDYDGRRSSPEILSHFSSFIPITTFFLTQLPFLFFFSHLLFPSPHCLLDSPLLYYWESKESYCCTSLYSHINLFLFVFKVAEYGIFYLS